MHSFNKASFKALQYTENPACKIYFIIHVLLKNWCIVNSLKFFLQSMSGSGLHLKKKNVTSLVQKWQKVKKEVEIEERNREEREQAIRQKLEEWKQEYSW